MAFKMKRSVARKTSEKYKTTIGSVTANMTDKELRDMVKKHNEGKASKWNVSYNTLVKQRRSLQPKDEKKKEIRESKVKEPRTTIAEGRQSFFDEDQFTDVGGFKGTQKLSEEREAARLRDIKSGYTKQLRNALEEEYGASEIHSLSELTQQGKISPEEFRQAQYQMVDTKSGQLLPMSSPSGQYTEDYSPFNKKSPTLKKGFKMPGWGKRK